MQAPIKPFKQSKSLKNSGLYCPPQEKAISVVVEELPEHLPNVAADPAFVSAADAASARLGVYVHGLNAHAGLHAALDATLRAAAAGHVVLTAEEARVAALLRTECEREGGLLLGDGPRGELLGMQAELAAASVRFRQNIAAPEQFGAAPARPPSSLFLPILPPSLFSPGPTGAHGAPRLTPEWG